MALRAALARRREARALALSARSDVLRPVVTAPPEGGSVFSVLLATSTAAPPFRGRRAELERLDHWWNDPSQPPVLVLTGPAGIGKTRLVTEFAASREAPWRVGWLPLTGETDAVKAVRACGAPVLILVDDADQQPALAALLTDLEAELGARPPVRAILITRASGLADRLAVALDDASRGILTGISELPLGPFGSREDRVRWLREAASVYARARKMPAPEPDVPGYISGQFADPDESLLTLNALALLVVLDAVASGPVRPDADTPSFDEVAGALFEYEQRRWRETVKLAEWDLAGLTGSVLAHSITALLLVGPASEEEAASVLRIVPGLSDAAEERLTNIARWAAHLYPGDPAWPIQMKPSKLAEWFLVTQLTQSPALASALPRLTTSHAAAALQVIARASDHMSQGPALFAGLVASCMTDLAGPAMTASLCAREGRPRLDAEIAQLIAAADWQDQTLRELGLTTEATRVLLPLTDAAVLTALVQIGRTRGDAASLGTALLNLGAGLSRLGRHEEAVAAEQECVALWRPLADANPGFLPSLARALDNFGVGLSRLGRYEEAAAAEQECVALWRPLADGQAGHVPNLARALDNFGVGLSRLGRHEEALAAEQECVALWRALADANPGLLPSLARALNNLSVYLGRMERYREGLAAAEESVALWRALADANPGHLPSLANALENLAGDLSGLQLDSEASAAAREAIALTRALASANSAYQPRLDVAIETRNRLVTVLPEAP
jgi:tetratricopeptide (TPR) repeat protein